MTKEATKDFIEALIETQQVIGKVYKEKINPHFKNKYVPLNSILAEIKPALNDNGFFLSQTICIQGNNEVLKTEIIHTSGDKLSSCAPLNIADKSNPQKYGSFITYMRRYSLTALLGLEEDDDDGQRGAQIVKQEAAISSQQSESLQDLLESVGKNKIDFCKAMKITGLNQLPQSKLEGVVKRLKEIQNGNN